MNRSTILLLGLAAWVLAACGSSTSMEEAHEDEHDTWRSMTITTTITTTATKRRSTSNSRMARYADEL